MENIRLLENELNGKKIAYHSESEFLVQLGKGSKGSYRTRYSFKGNLGQAVLYFNGLNVGNGYKKRLVCWSLNKPVLARAVSY